MSERGEQFWIHRMIIDVFANKRNANSGKSMKPSVARHDNLYLFYFSAEVRLILNNHLPVENDFLWTTINSSPSIENDLHSVYFAGYIFDYRI